MSGLVKWDVSRANEPLLQAAWVFEESTKHVSQQLDVQMQHLAVQVTVSSSCDVPDIVLHILTCFAAALLFTCQEKRKDYTFRLKITEKPGNIPGCPNK